jgi:hypothetical protein
MYSSSSPYARVRYSHEGKGGTLKFVSRCLLVCSAYLTGRVRRSLSYTERAIIKAVVHDMKKRSTHFLKLELRVPVLACWSRGYYRRNGLHTSRALSCVYRYSPAGQGVIITEETVYTLLGPRAACTGTRLLVKGSLQTRHWAHCIQATTAEHKR